MFVLWVTLAGTAVWLELAYHFSGFGWTVFNPVYSIMLIVAWSGVWTLLIGLLKGRVKKIIYYVAIWLPVLWFCAQLVYLRIFKQPLLWVAMIQGGGDALTNYWREALDGLLKALPFLILFMLPAIFVPILLKRHGWQIPQFTSLQIMRTLVVVVAGVAGSFVWLEVGKLAGWDFYEEYHEFYDPLTVAEDMGVFPLFCGDTTVRLQWLAKDIWQPKAVATGTKNEQSVQGTNGMQGTGVAPDSTVSSNAAVTSGSIATSGAGATSKPASTPNSDLTQESSETLVIRPQQFQLDYEKLHELADNAHQTWLADYIENQIPVNTNEYTGMFEGYNLIFLTAEGFCTYAIDEELTPTLYRMANSGFVCRNYYVPLWQTSTSDGEYINLTGLIPDQQYSMRRSSANVQPFVLPGFFAGENVYSYAYHNNSLTYYDRYLSHPNLGYDFKACKLGGLDESQWGDKVFEMEQPNQWPASDYNMMVGTVPEYVNTERFNVYYLTVSGHMNYSYKSNAMSSKNKDAVAELELSPGPKAYLACNIELDKAMENLLAQLEEAGQLENTVICMSADHYPYGLTDQEYEELAGKNLSAGKDKFRNTLILWNAGMEEPVYIDKACGSMDILPTLLNLFGFDYDSRMYAGRDILSDREGMVIFNNRDFVTDSVIFIEKGDITTWLQDEEGNDLVPDEQKEAYLKAARQEVKDRYNFSAYIIQENYYSDVLQAVMP